MDLFSSLERDFKELHCFSLLEMVETCAGEKGLAYFTLQSCKSSSPWSFSFRLQFRLRVSADAQPWWRGGQARNLCFWRRVGALLSGINTLGFTGACWLFPGASFFCARLFLVDIAEPRVSFPSWKKRRFWPIRWKSCPLRSWECLLCR